MPIPMLIIPESSNLSKISSYSVFLEAAGLGVSSALTGSKSAAFGWFCLLDYRFVLGGTVWKEDKKRANANTT